MSIRSLLLLIVGVAIALLAELNWSALAAVQPISLGFGVVHGPLGLIWIGLTALLAAVFLIYIFYMHSTVLFESRRHSKELQSQRELADKAEASRFTELRAFLESRGQEARAQRENQKQELLSRMAAVEHALALRLEQVDNASAAFFGELSDRIERKTTGQAADMAEPAVLEPLPATPRQEPY
jgi:hypothetical protein